MKRVLFLCGKGKHRSPTAADILARERDIETDFAGLSADADVPLSQEQIDWSTDIAVMEKRQLGRLKRKYGAHLKGKRIVCLDIADDFLFMQDELVALLESRLRRIT